MERCALEHDFRGFEIGSHIEQWNLDDLRFEPVYAAAEQLDVALFVHPWGMDIEGRRSAFWLPWLVAMPAETAAAIVCLLMGGILHKHPKLRICFAHGGGAYPFLKGRIEHGYRVRPDLCGTHCDQAPSEFTGKFWTDSLVHSEESFRLLLETVGERRIILGSDYPFPLGEHRPGELIEKYCAHDQQLKTDLLWRNAAEFLRLK